MTAPSGSKRKPRRVGPISVFQSRHRHEIRAGQFVVSESGMVGTGNCNQLPEVSPVPLSSGCAWRFQL